MSEKRRYIFSHAICKGKFSCTREGDRWSSLNDGVVIDNTEDETESELDDEEIEEE